MTDWGMTGRRDSFEFALVDPFTLEETGEAAEVVDGESSLTWGYYTDNLCSGSIALFRETGRDKLIRVKHTVTLPDGTSASGTYATLFIEDAAAEALSGKVTRSANCYSTLWRLTQDTLERDFARPAGYNIVDEVRELVEADGGRLLVDPGVDSSRLHTVDVWFEVGENRAEVLRQIAEWTDCELGVEEFGYVTWSPYVAPADRPVSYTFEEGRNCMYVAGFKLSDSRADAVNRVVAHFSRTSKQDDPEKDNYDPFPLADSVFVDLPAGHPYSYETVGRRRTHDMDVSEPCSHEDLTSQAERYLWEHAGATEFYEIECAGVPGLRCGQVVRYLNSRDATAPLDLVCLVSEMTVDLKPGCPTKLKLEVVR